MIFQYLNYFQNKNTSNFRNQAIIFFLQLFTIIKLNHHIISNLN